MKKIIVLTAITSMFAIVGWIEKGMADNSNCNPTTFYGCSAEYRIKAQQQQFGTKILNQRAALANLNHQKAIRARNKRIQEEKQAIANRKYNEKRKALARHESARNDRRRSSIMSQTSDGTWIQTDIQRGKSRW